MVVSMYMQGLIDCREAMEQLVILVDNIEDHNPWSDSEPIKYDTKA